jgi:hypothetical protein
VVLTFVESGVLIARARGTDDVAPAALAVLDDSRRSLASSFFVKLETIPKAAANRTVFERQFYETFFASVRVWSKNRRSVRAARIG